MRAQIVGAASEYQIGNDVGLLHRRIAFENQLELANAAGNTNDDRYAIDKGFSPNVQSGVRFREALKVDHTSGDLETATLKLVVASHGVERSRQKEKGLFFFLQTDRSGNFGIETLASQPDIARNLYRHIGGQGRGDEPDLYGDSRRLAGDCLKNQAIRAYFARRYGV